MTGVASFARPLVVLAHPGSELRLFGWLGRFRAPVLTWTDGGGQGRWPRAEASRQVLRQAGAMTLEPFGDVESEELFRSFLEFRPEPFFRWFDILSEYIERENATDLLTEAAEGHHPLTDTLRHFVGLIGAIRKVRVWEWPASGPPVSVVPVNGEVIDLTDFEFHRKLDAAHRYIDLAPEVDECVNEHGTLHFQREVLTPGLPWNPAPWMQTPPRYEARGEVLKSKRIVAEEIRYADHVMPIWRAVETRAFASGRIAA